MLDHWETLLPLGQSDSVDFEHYFGNFITQKNRVVNNETGVSLLKIYFQLTLHLTQGEMREISERDESARDH